MEKESGTRVSGGFDPLVHAIKQATRSRHAFPGESPEQVDHSETRGVRPAYLDRSLGHEMVHGVEELSSTPDETLAETE